MREKPGPSSAVTSPTGITPACAGKTSRLQHSIHLAWDHPRVCGKNYAKAVSRYLRPGSPPRVREKLNCLIERFKRLRITPACAGKTGLVAIGGLGWWDHPRVCGKNSIWMRQTTLHSGSPPRVREKRYFAGLFSDLRGITPACAGKTFLVQIYYARF